MKADGRMTSALACWVMMAVFVLGLVYLGVRLKTVQLDSAAELKLAEQRQSLRRVQTAGGRGRILDRRGELLAGNRVTVSIVCDAAAFRRRTWTATAAAIREAVDEVARVIGRPAALEDAKIRRHLRQTLAMPLTVWNDVDRATLARFCEHARELPGFAVVEREERIYPQGSLAAHVIGYVGRELASSEAGDTGFHFRERELCGRAGLEIYYDSYLRGVAGERKLLVDARGFTHGGWTVAAARRGPDLRLALDSALQRAVESELAGEKGACVVLDPRDGSVLAMASSPTYDLRSCVPFLPHSFYKALCADPSQPTINRAVMGAYAPGSTFKPVTAVAALSTGHSAHACYQCDGVYTLGGMKLHCTRRWGHGILDLKSALKFSCNPFFCNLGVEVGTNALFTAAREFGLGARTGIDLKGEESGLVPDDAWKFSHYGDRWRTGDLAQMSIGQGMLLATPLQMALVAGAIGTGYAVRPHLKLGLDAERRPLDFPSWALMHVRQGMEKVVNDPDGTGRRGGAGLPVRIAGKTGTAEVGAGERKRKNTWFIAYAPAEKPTLAVAMVIENGDSGGGTTAPKVHNVLAAAFGPGGVFDATDEGRRR